MASYQASDAIDDNDTLIEIVAEKSHALIKVSSSNCVYCLWSMNYFRWIVYGACGTKTCPRSQANNCFKMLDREYKFYLAFENSKLQRLHYWEAFCQWARVSDAKNNTLIFTESTY